MKFKRVSEGGATDAVASFGVGDLVQGVKTQFAGIITKVSTENGQTRYCIKSFHPVTISGKSYTKFNVTSDKIQRRDSEYLKKTYGSLWSMLIEGQRVKEKGFLERKSLMRDDDPALSYKKFQQHMANNPYSAGTPNIDISSGRFLPDTYDSKRSPMGDRYFTSKQFLALFNKDVRPHIQGQNLRVVNAMGGTGYHTLWFLANGISAVTVDKDPSKRPFKKMKNCDQMSERHPYIRKDLTQGFSYKPHDVLFMSYPDDPGTHVSRKVVEDYTAQGGRYVLAIYEREMNMSGQTETYLFDHYECVGTLHLRRDEGDEVDSVNPADALKCFRRKSLD